MLNAGKLSLTATRDVIATGPDMHIVYHVTLEQATRNDMRTVLCVSVIFFLLTNPCDMYTSSL